MLCLRIVWLSRCDRCNRVLEEVLRCCFIKFSESSRRKERKRSQSMFQGCPQSCLCLMKHCRGHCTLHNPGKEKLITSHDRWLLVSHARGRRKLSPCPSTTNQKGFCPSLSRHDTTSRIGILPVQVCHVMTRHRGEAFCLDRH